MKLISVLMTETEIIQIGEKALQQYDMGLIKANFHS